MKVAVISEAGNTDEKQVKKSSEFFKLNDVWKLRSSQYTFRST